MRPNQQGLSAWGIALAFLITVGGARLLSYVSPGMHFDVGGVHIHHYVYGIFILTIAGYLALVFHGPRARSWIALLYGCGVGLTFDEFGFWINPIFQRGVRWNNRGITIIVAGLVMVSLVALMRRRRADETSAIGSIPEPRTVQIRVP